MRLPPPFLLALTFLTLIPIGTLLLLLPVSTQAPITVLDAAFTATSAITVTGLTVVDTGATFTRFGQTVIAVLIQIGGLGLMTFAVLALATLGHRIGLREQLLLREDLNQTSLGDLIGLVKVIFLQVLLFETIGFALLASRWVPELGLSEGLFSAFFHAVSAFNNAGFSLYSNSLTRWAGDPTVNLVIPALFITGGLGFAVINELWKKRRFATLSLHTKLMIVGTIGLNVWAVAAFAALEWHNPETLGALANTGDRLWAAWFQATTTRTAGFNTIDNGALTDAGALTTISLMIIGGGTTSTAGGIKVTTFMALILATVAFLRRQPAPHAFGRALGPEAILKVLAVAFMGVLTVMVGTFLITATHSLPFLDVAFEAASAFGTVGLSRGITGELTPVGQAVLMGLMFLGRVGPLSLAFILATSARGPLRYPQEPVFLG